MNSIEQLSSEIRELQRQVADLRADHAKRIESLASNLGTTFALSFAHMVRIGLLEKRVPEMPSEDEIQAEIQRAALGVGDRESLSAEALEAELKRMKLLPPDDPAK